MLARFERLVEDTLEGSLRRVFPSQLQPVQLAKAAARAMEEAQVVGVRTTEVPNAYALRLNPSDLERFADYTTSLARQVVSYLEEYAADRGLILVSTPVVELLPDRAVPPGAVRASARFRDLEPARQEALETMLEGTRALRVRPRKETEPPPTAAEYLEDSFGGKYPLDNDASVLRMGRSVENDVTIASQRVSRYHAQLRWEGGRWFLLDLGSTNGTFLNGTPVEAPAALSDGAIVRLGDYDLTFHAPVRAG